MLEPRQFGSDVLASDAERERAVMRLHEAVGEGRLTLEEFSARVRDVLASRTRGQLAAITADLPSPRAARPGQRLSVAVMSEVKRKGRWVIDGETTAISVMGSCTLDLTGAVLLGNEIVVDTWVLMGAVKIVVPPGTPVEMEGFAFMGARSSKVDDDAALPDLPVVRVRGLTVMGSVEVISSDPSLLDRLATARERLVERKADRSPPRLEPGNARDGA